IILFILRAIIRKYWTPIRDIPGPFLASFSKLWLVYHLRKGHGEKKLIDFHKKHGYFVRISENEVSASHPDAVKQLPHANIAKILPDYHYVNQMSELNPKRHIEMSRNIAAGFALSNIIKSESHVDAILHCLKEHLDALSKSNQVVEFDKWFNFFAFPEGVVVSINAWVFHRNPQIFGADCNSFNLDRWPQTDTSYIDSFLIHERIL
ncbi:hypothetical protein N7471_005705, partial [Penicillium samsonianum]|uniref:uncharacterized protein n=1 Tax=Penicillium samsonianum TaxID=1882272 RepID=UPI0025495AAF